MDTLPQSSSSTSGNLTPSHASTLFAAVNRSLSPRSAGSHVVFWESDRSFGGHITPAQAETIVDSFRRGGSLLLTFGANPQSKIMLLSKMLPSIPWNVAANWSEEYGPRPSVRGGATDSVLFPSPLSTRGQHPLHPV